VAYPVYSVRLFEALRLSGNLGYTCPAGVATVLRDVDATVYGNSGTAQFYVGGAVGQFIWLIEAGAGAAESYQWRGRQVFNPGDIITFSAGGMWDITASGYHLTLP
jgi:hypothetical protein